MDGAHQMSAIFKSSKKHRQFRFWLSRSGGGGNGHEDLEKVYAASTAFSFPRRVIR